MLASIAYTGLNFLGRYVISVILPLAHSLAVTLLRLIETKARIAGKNLFHLPKSSKARHRQIHSHSYFYIKCLHAVENLSQKNFIRSALKSCSTPFNSVRNKFPSEKMLL